MPVLSSVVLLVAVAVGGALQRVAGMGFAMVVAPFVVLLLAGQQGVVLTNMLGAAAGLLLVWPTRADVSWTRLALLTVSTVVGAAAGALVVSSLDVAVLRIVLGVVLIAAIAISLRAARLSVHVTDPRWALLAGGATGTLVTMSGIGAPPMTVYAVASNWPHRSFAATMQPYVAVSSAIGAGTLLLASPASLPQLPAWTWVAAAVALVIGLIAGNLLSRVVSEAAGRHVVVVLGLIGAVTAIVAGAAALLSR